MRWQRRTVLLLTLLSVISLVGFAGSVLWRAPVPASQPAGNSAIQEPSDTGLSDDIPDYYIRRKIDGAYVEPDQANWYPVAVMIDNDPNARLQSGLAHAQVVYEAKAEAGITRFMALFATNEQLDAIGPVRSARPYFVRWAQGYGALYTHVGGSPEALEYLDAIDMPDINEFYSGKYFWRSEEKFPPHNVYTNSKNLATYLDRSHAQQPNYRSWRYKPEMPASTTDDGRSGIAVNYSVADFAVQWEYDVARNAYRRYMGGVPHNDADGTPIYAKNVLIMVVPAEVVDEEFRRHMQNVGSGEAWYCLDGMCNEGTWKKDSATAREIFYDGNGNEIALNGGATWVQVVQSRGEVSF